MKTTDDPSEYVAGVIRSEAKSSSLAAIAEMAGVSRGTINSIVNHGKARPATLMNVILKLRGQQAKAEFLVRFRDRLQVLAQEIRWAEDWLRMKGVGFTTPNKRERQVLMLTGSDSGIAEEKLYSTLPFRKQEISDLIERGVIQKVDGRLYSKLSSDTFASGMDAIQDKIDILRNMTESEKIRGFAFTGDYCVSPLGFQEILDVMYVAVEAINKIKQNRSVKDGIHFSLGQFVQTIFLDLSNAEQIDGEASE
jgi:hypothetical protein